MPWVLICRTGAPLAASRRASLSVSRSPTSAATRAPRARSSLSVRCKNAVFPVPGLETRFSTSTPAASNRPRSSRASSSFFFRIPCRSSTIRVVIASLPPARPQSRTTQSPAPARRAHRSPARRSCGHRKLCRLSSSPSVAARSAVHRHRNRLHHQPRPGQRRALGGNPPAELQRILHHRRQHPHPQPHLQHLRARIFGQRLRYRIHHARSYGKLMHFKPILRPRR